MVEYDVPNTLRLADSAIHGKGVFTTAPIAAGEYIAKARIGNSRTPAGRYTNHSCLPNCELVKHDGDIYLKALVDISGCLGGSVGTELTIDYRNAVAVNPELTKRGE
jgi:SET domain-containing protein